MVLLQYCDYTKYFMYTNSTLLFNFESFVAFLWLLLQRNENEKGNKKNLNVNDHKNRNLEEETVWSPWQTMVSMVNIGSNGCLPFLNLNSFFYVYIITFTSFVFLLFFHYCFKVSSKYQLQANGAQFDDRMVFLYTNPLTLGVSVHIFFLIM